MSTTFTAPTGATTTTFRELGVDDTLATILDEQGLASPFPIQAATLPDALAGRDVAGEAPTGSGKTLAFALPIAARVAKGKPGRPRALVLVPTRELAAQVRDTIIPFAGRMKRHAATFYGGTSLRTDQQRLRKGVDIAIATPGRLEDLVKRRDIDLGDVDIVVIDEADRMADMGFLPVVKRLLDQTSSERQTLLFSATLDGDVDKLVKRYQRQPSRHRLERLEEDRGDVRHVFFAAERPERRDLTARIVRDRGPAIVFTRTKHGADRLAKQLGQSGISTAAIHGNRSQNQRERALKRFADGEVTALIATDVAARGIHVDDVAIVVHHDLPTTDKDYVHRSGRTGRAGALGLVVSLVGAEQLKDLDDIQRQLDMPRGLHALDLDVLDAEVIPDPTRPGGARGAGQGTRSGGRPSGNGSARRRGNGGRARAGKSQGQGQSGDRSRGHGGSNAGRTRAGKAQGGDHSGGQGGNRNAGRARRSRQR